MRIKREIFKEYDIRGIYPREIDGQVAYLVGRHVPKFISSKSRVTLVVGQDARKSSPPLTKKLIEGLMESGADILDIGTVTTPMLYFAVSALKAGGGVMTTASHNPQKYDGFKIVRKLGMPAGGQELQALYRMIQKGLPAAAKRPGQYKKVDITKEYFDTLFSNFHPTRPVKIALEYGTGAAKLFAKELGSKLPDAKPKQKIDFYVSFDYDADRLMIMDENKKELRGDEVGAIVGDVLLKKGDRLVFEPRVSWGVRKHFLNKGVKIIPSRVGHYNIKRTMGQKKAALGIEVTGHIYFGQLNYSEAPFLVIRYIIDALDKNPEKKMSEIFKQFGNWHNSGAMDLKIKNWEKIFAKLKTHYKTGAQNYMDGLTVEFPNRWWFNIRPSHTEPVVRLVVEANSEELLKEKIKEIKNLINPK